MLPVTIKPDTWQNINTLKSLGLDAEWLKEICLRALAAYSQATPHDAANAAGSYAYFAAVRAARDMLCPQGWDLQRQHNVELTKNPENNISLAVSSGDEGTGVENAIPRTKNPKGPQTKKMVAQNAKQFILPGMEDKLNWNTVSESTYILLFHVDTVKSEMRMELSLPIEMDIEKMRVVGWKKRIILPPVEFSPPITISESDSEPEIEIIVKRRDDE